MIQYTGIYTGYTVHIQYTQYIVYIDIYNIQELTQKFILGGKEYQNTILIIFAF